VSWDHLKSTLAVWLSILIGFPLLPMFLAEDLFAQQANTNPAIVVAACNTAALTSGNRSALTVDVNGNLCAGVSVSATIATDGLATGISQGVANGSNVGTLAQAVATTAAPAYVGGTINPLSVDLTGALRVNGTFSPAANATVDLNRISGAPLIGIGSGMVAVMGGASAAASQVGGPVVVGGVSGTTVQSATVNNQTPAGTEYGFITRNIPSGTQTVSGTVTVTDGAGALNTIIDSGTITTITNAVTVTDGAGALNVIVDSGTVTSITNAVAVTDNGGNLSVDFNGVVPALVSAAQVMVLANTSGTSGIVGGVNVAQVAGQTPVVVSGVPATFLAATSGSNIIGGVNLAQYNGVAPVQVSGTPVVTLAATSGTGNVGGVIVSSSAATGSSVATLNPVYIGGDGSGNLFPVIACDQVATISLASSGTTEVIAKTSGKSIYVCSYALFAAGTTNVKLLSGTTSGAGAGCTAGTSNVTGNFNFTAQTGIARGSGLGMVTKAPISAALCVVNSQAIEIDGEVTYSQF
jgi:hypothetical protein